MMTNADNVLQLRCILEGRPQITQYFSTHDELCIQDGLVFRDKHLVILKEMKLDIKHDLHIGHSSVEGTLC